MGTRSTVLRFARFYHTRSYDPISCYENSLYGPIKLRIVHDDEFLSRRRNESDNGSVPYPLQLIRRFQGWACFGNCVPVDTLVYIPHRIFPYKVSGIRPVWEPDQVC